MISSLSSRNADHRLMQKIKSHARTGSASWKTKFDQKYRYFWRIMSDFLSKTTRFDWNLMSCWHWNIRAMAGRLAMMSRTRITAGSLWAWFFWALLTVCRKLINLKNHKTKRKFWPSSKWKIWLLSRRPNCMSWSVAFGEFPKRQSILKISRIPRQLFTLYSNSNFMHKFNKNTISHVRVQPAQTTRLVLEYC